jgi:hypothetical protein
MVGHLIIDNATPDTTSGQEVDIVISNDGDASEIGIVLNNEVAGLEVSEDDGSTWNTGSDSFSLDAIPSRLFVVDSGNKRVVGRLKTDLTYTDQYDGTSVFNTPVHCCCDNEYIWVANQTYSNIIKLTIGLAFVETFGSLGTGNNQFNQVSGVITDDTHLYVADQINHRVMKLLKSDFSFVAKIGSNGSGNDNFVYPQQIAVDETYIYVTDYGNHRVVKRLKSDLSYVSEYGTLGTGNDNLNNPEGVTADSTHIYICDGQNNRVIKRLKSDLSYVNQYGTFGTGDDNLNISKAVSVDETYLYIVDPGNNRVIKRLKSDLSYVNQYGTFGGTGIDALQTPRGVCVEYNPFGFWTDPVFTKTIKLRHNNKYISTSSTNTTFNFEGTNTVTVTPTIDPVEDLDLLVENVSDYIKIQNTTAAPITININKLGGVEYSANGSSWNTPAAENGVAIPANDYITRYYRHDKSDLELSLPSVLTFDGTIDVELNVDLKQLIEFPDTLNGVESAEILITIINTKSTSLVLDDISVESQLEKSTAETSPVVGGGSTTVGFTFVPTTVGLVEFESTIDFDTTFEQLIDLSGTGLESGPVTYDVSTINFKNVKTDNTKTGTIVLTAEGTNRTVTISAPEGFWIIDPDTGDLVKQIDVLVEA